MSVTEGKHELRCHIPKRTHQYLKKQGEGKGIGQLIADCVDVYQNQTRVSRNVETLMTQMEQVLTLLAEQRGSPCQ